MVVGWGATSNGYQTGIGQNYMESLQERRRVATTAKAATCGMGGPPRGGQWGKCWTPAGSAYGGNLYVVGGVMTADGAAANFGGTGFVYLGVADFARARGTRNGGAPGGKSIGADTVSSPWAANLMSPPGPPGSNGQRLGTAGTTGQPESAPANFGLDGAGKATTRHRSPGRTCFGSVTVSSAKPPIFAKLPSRWSIPPRSVYGQSVDFTATVQSEGSTPPTGTVQLYYRPRGAGRAPLFGLKSARRG